MTAPRPPFVPCPEEALQALTRKSKRLGAVISRLGPIQRLGDPDLFSAVVRAITGQQISSKAQATLMRRLAEALGAITPEAVCRAGAPALHALGLSERKAACILRFAEQIQSGDICPETLAALPDAEAIACLCQIKGVGVWTAEMILLFCLHRPDILSFDDFGIRRGLRMIMRRREISRAAFEQFRRRVSPYGSVASLYLWAVAGGALLELNDPAAAASPRSKRCP